MQDLIGQNGSFSNVPHIPSTLEIRDYLSVIPEGFEDILKSEITSDGIALTLLNDEYENNTIVIPKIILNPDEAKVQFPRFLIERTTYQNKKIDYFNPANFGDRYIFNQLELLYIVLQHRLSQFQKQTVAYSYLLKRDISQVASFVQYVPSVAYNAKRKNDNAYIIMSLYSKREATLGEFKAGTLGDMIKFKSYIPDDREWKTLAPFLPIHCSSESGASDNGKLILRPYEEGPLYRSVGHDIVYDERHKVWVMKSLFKSAQNITARSKTHVTANAYPIMNFQPTSVFIDDWVYDWDAYPDEDNPVVEGYKPKDHCYRRALCVIRPIDEKRSHYLFGEAELIQNHYDSFVWDDYNLTEVFDELVIPTDGTLVYPESKTDDFGYVTKSNRILVGYRYKGEEDVPIYIYDVEAVAFVRRKLTDGPEGKERITFRVAKPAGNARCDSNTGFKAVTKAKPYLGKIILEDGTELKPEIAFGMNSFKAKGAGIAAARAALAVELKTYTPQHWSGLLDTLDEEEMQNASDSLPSFKYYDEFGNYQHNVQIGVIYYRYTEIASTFKSFRDQALSHETGRNLYHNENRDLYNFLWKNYVNPEMAEAMKEMQKVLVKADIYEGDEDMPHYAPNEIRSGSLFNLEEDILTSTIVHQPFTSKVLDEEFNPKGFFIDFRGHGGPLVRVPSAKTLKLFENKLESGAWMYHRMFISLSKIIRACLTMPRTGARFGYLFSKPNDKVQRSTLTSRYFSDVKGVIFVSEDSKEMNVTVFSRPMVPGIAMKQVVEPLLPPGTALIMCKDTYDKAVKYCYGEEYETELLKHSFYGFHVRNPSLWRTQVCKLRIWNADDFRLYLMSKHGISLEKYLCVKENHDILLFSPDVCEASHSDNDGDHSAVYIPHGVEGQRIMREFILSDVCPDEILWTKKYIAGEVEANDSLIDSKGELIHPVYKLYDVPLQEYKVGRDVVSAYVTYFFQALAAKKGIGAATNDGWVFAMILEAYQAYARKHDYEYVDEEKNIKLPMIRLTRAKFFMYSFIYIRGLQDFVVTGVKHNDNGSADFDNLLLRNMVDEKNHKKVTQILTNQLGLEPKFANEIIRIVTWANLSGVYQSCAAFLRLYNKGNEPKKEDEEVFNKLESFIQENTYFGRLLKDLYDIIYKYRHYETIAEEETAKQLEALSKDFLKDLDESPQDDILI